MNSFPRGQATIELLLILTLLFIILGFAIQSYSENQKIVNEKKNILDAQRNASILRTAIESAAYAPIGSSLRVFLPPAAQDQNIRVINGVVEIRTVSIVINLPSLVKDLNMSLVHDGNILIITHTPTGVRVS